jgi:glutamyl/glutaminyl-tRNA synthetase
LPEALINYLALLGWHPEGEREIFTLEELIGEFNLARIQKGAGIFDEVKLRWFNHEHLKHLDDNTYATRLRDFRDKNVDPRLVPLLKERAQTLQEAAKMLESEFGFLGEISYDSAILLRGGKIEKETASNHLKALEDLLGAIPDEGFTAAQLKDTVWPYATAQGRGAVLWPLRVALSGKEKSPDPFVIASLIGKKETLARIARAAENL